jgi:hypothetical protein
MSDSDARKAHAVGSPTPLLGFVNSFQRLWTHSGSYFAIASSHPKLASLLPA